jgi:hypothetical protein
VFVCRLCRRHLDRLCVGVCLCVRAHQPAASQIPACTSTRSELRAPPRHSNRLHLCIQCALMAMTTVRRGRSPRCLLVSQGHTAHTTSEDEPRSPRLKSVLQLGDSMNKQKQADVHQINAPEHVLCDACTPPTQFAKRLLFTRAVLLNCRPRQRRAMSSACKPSSPPQVSQHTVDRSLPPTFGNCMESEPCSPTCISSMRHHAPC